jgi:hypothetical protein
MPLFEDPITDALLQPGFLEEQEELDSQTLAPQYHHQPTIEGDIPSNVSLAIFLIDRPSTLLADSLLPISSSSSSTSSATASITVPSLQQLKSPLEEEYGTPHHHIHSSTISFITTNNNTVVAVVQVPTSLSPEQCSTWATKVLTTLIPSDMLILSTMMSMEYKGPISPNDDDIICSLQYNYSNTSDDGTTNALPPVLPSGTLIGGLTAALFQKFEVLNFNNNNKTPSSSSSSKSRGRAVALIAVQSSPVPQTQLLMKLGHHGAHCLDTFLCEKDDKSSSWKSETAVKLIGRKVDMVYRSSAANSMFT